MNVFINSLPYVFVKVARVPHKIARALKNANVLRDSTLKIRYKTRICKGALLKAEVLAVGHRVCLNSFENYLSELVIISAR